MIFRDRKLHLLVVEDNVGDFLLIQEFLSAEITEFTVHNSKTYFEAKQKLEVTNHIDAILLDLTLPDKSGAELVDEIVIQAGAIPIIVLTGHEDRAFGVQTLSMGVSDYLLKEDLNGSYLVKSIAYSIERKKNIRTLQDSEEKYKNIFSVNPLPMWIEDLETGCFMDVNEAALRKYGFTRDEFLSLSIKDLTFDADPKVFANYSQDLELSDGYFHEICRHKKKNGEIIIVEIKINDISLTEKKARLILANDITTRYKTEESLRLSERRFKALVQEGSDMISVLSLDGTYLYVSPTSTLTLGTPSENYIGKSVFDYIHVQDHEKIHNCIELLKSQKRIFITPFRFMTAGGEFRWIETILTNLMDDPSVNGIVANSKDVTENLAYELKLRESVARYNIVAKATSDTIWDWDLKNDLVLWNKGIKDVFGYEDDDISKYRTWWNERLHPEDSERIIGSLARQIKNRSLNWREEYRFRCSDGTYKYVLDKGFLVLDKQNNPVRMLGAMQDISQRKEEEEHLKLLESVITHAKDAVLITKAAPLDSPGPQILYANKAFEEMSGYSLNEIIGNSPRILQGPNTSRAELRFLKQQIKKGEPCSIELVNYNKSGEQYWVQIDVAPVKNNYNDVTHFISIQRDVTEQKNYIQAIENQNIKLREIGWMQSHIVRAPLARIMGLLEYLQNQTGQDPTDPDLLENIYVSATELDRLLREIVNKSERVKINSKNGTESTHN